MEYHLNSSHFVYLEEIYTIISLTLQYSSPFQQIAIGIIFIFVSLPLVITLWSMDILKMASSFQVNRNEYRYFMNSDIEK